MANPEGMEVRYLHSQLYLNPEPPAAIVDQQNLYMDEVPLGAGQPRGNGQFNMDMNDDMNCENGDDDDNDDIRKDLVFSRYYYIMRFGRTLKRSEVLGFGFISLTVISIALLAQLGLVALGYFEPSGISEGHPPHTFSWKLLTEFYMSDSLSNVDKDCLFFNKKRFMFQRDEDPMTYLERLRSEVQQLTEEAYSNEGLGNETNEGILPHKPKCKYTRVGNGWGWLSKFISSMFFSFLSVICSMIYLSSLRCRRKKTLQFGLLVPSFVCFFLDIFQQIPLTFHFNYANMVLTQDMQNALALTMPPVLISPIWEETQIHEQCCGIQTPETWNMQGFEGYPRSCCNTTAFSCPKDSFPTREQVWSVGCYSKEYDRLRHFEGCALLIMFMKLVAEIGLFWTLSDLTRYDYPAPEHVRSSQCHVKGYEVTTKGCVTTLGVTERQVAAIKLRNFQPGKYIISPNETATGQTITVRTVDKIMGTVEIRPQRQLPDRNNENPTINLERGRNRGIIFVSF